MGYCTIEDLDLTYTLGYHSDAQKQRAIDMATEWIDKITGNTFTNETNTARIFDGQGETTMFIAAPRLRSVTKVEVRDDSESDWEEVDLTDIDYSDGWIEYKDNVFPKGKSTVRITGDWGYETVPTPIKEACAEIAAMKLEGRIGDITSEGVLSRRIGRQTDVISVNKILRAYRLHKLVFAVVHGRKDTETPAEDL